MPATTFSKRIGEYFSAAIDTPKCPVCQSTQFRDSRSRLRDLPFMVLRAKPRRCLRCYRRFYTWHWFRPA